MTELPDQDERARIDHELDRDLLVAAGAGSGKTTKLVDRYLALLAAGREPDEIAVVTFTRKAAAEMKDRLREALADRARREPRWRGIVNRLEDAPIETIDAFCLRLLRAEAMTAGIDPGFEILDEASQESLPRQIAETVLRRALASHQPAAVELLAAMDSFPAAVDAIVSGIKRRRRWRNPFAAGPDHLIARRVWSYLRDESDDLPSCEELTAALLADQDAWLARCLKERSQSSECGELREAWAELAERSAGVPADDPFLAIYRCAERWLQAVEGGEWESARDCLGQLRALDYRRGSGRPWGGIRICDYRKHAIALRDWGKATFPDGQEPLLTAAATATLALLPLVKAAEDALWRRKLQLGALAFDDLVLNAAELLAPAENADLLARLRRRYSAVLVDEYQDTDRLQDRLFRHLAGDRPGSFFAVGDDKQSIYGWRNAEIEVFNEARETAGEGLVELTTTFRLTPPLAATLNRLFASPTLMGPEQHLEPQAARFAPLQAIDDPARVRLPGEPVRLLVSELETESEAIAAEIERLVAEPPTLTGQDGCPRPLDYGDIGVLSPDGSPLDPVREALLAHGIPVRTERGKLCRRAEVADLLALVRWLLTPSDGVALLAILRSPLFSVADDTLYWLARERPLPAAFAALVQSDGGAVDGLDPEQQRGLDRVVGQLRSWREGLASRPLAALLRELIDETDYRAVQALLPDPGRRLANLEKLLDEVDLLSQRGLGATEVLEMLEARRESGPRDDHEGLEYDADAAAVTLTTIHKAKGLEWPVVIVTGLAKKKGGGGDKGIRLGVWHGLPICPGEVNGECRLPVMLKAAAAAKGPRLEFEQERLLYVALTRARDRLILSAPLDRNGRSLYPPSSQFAALAEAMEYQPDQPLAFPGIEVQLAGDSQPAPDPIEPLREQVARLARLELEPGELPPPPAPPPRVLSPSALAQEVARETARVRRVERVQLPPPVREKMTGFQRGSIIHELLRLAAATRREPRLEEVWPAAVGQGVLLDREADLAVAEHLLATAAAAFALPIVQSALEAEELLGEVPFLLADGERILEGRMDLVAVWPRRVLLIDYKTGGLSDQLLAQYAAETRLYARALTARFPGRAIEVQLPLLDLGRVESITPTTE